MYRVFNMGIGIVIVTDKTSAHTLQNQIPEETFVLGQLVKGTKKVQLYQ
jgi:phosphoribosylaminoimidazole (AIR) synthetase